MKELELRFHGKVQGVGMRQFVCDKALEMDLVGYVENMDDGSVEVIAQGNEEALQKFLEEVKDGPYFARVDKLVVEWSDASDAMIEFEIIK